MPTEFVRERFRCMQRPVSEGSHRPFRRFDQRLLLRMTGYAIDLLPHALALGIDLGLIVMLQCRQFGRYCERESLPSPALVNQQVLEIAVQEGGAVPQTGNPIHHARKAASEMG